MSAFSAPNKQVLRDAILAVRLDADNHEYLQGIPLERLVENHNKMKAEVIAFMENCRNPVLLQVLEYVRGHFQGEEFMAIEVEIYAACNKAAMVHCALVDAIRHYVVLHDDAPP